MSEGAGLSFAQEEVIAGSGLFALKSGPTFSQLTQTVYQEDETGDEDASSDWDPIDGYGNTEALVCSGVAAPPEALLLMVDGATNADVSRLTGASLPIVSSWRWRFLVGTVQEKVQPARVVAPLALTAKEYAELEALLKRPHLSQTVRIQAEAALLLAQGMTCFEAYLWGQYRRVNELALQNGDAAYEYRLVFHRYLSARDAATLVDDLQSGRVMSISLIFADSDGVKIPVVLDEAVPLKAEAIDKAIVATVKALPVPTPIRQQLNDAASQDHAMVLYMNVIAPSSQVKLWLDRHLEDVRLIQPLVDQVDKLQLDYCPDCRVP
ncbi:MAG: hypothetical protein ABIP96_05755 [Patescibacteria group bacterium]